MGRSATASRRRRLLLIGAASFAAASLLAALSTSVMMLIIARALLGVAGATLAPSTLSLIRALFEDPRQRTVAVGSGSRVSRLAAPSARWSAVSYSRISPGERSSFRQFRGDCSLLAVGPRLLPEYRSPDAGRADLLSAALSIAAVLSFVFGFKHLARDGWDATGAATITAGLGLGYVFAVRQRHLKDPLLDLRLFGVRGFDAALAANTIGFFVNFGSLLFLSQYLQAVRGLSPIAAGLWSVPSAGAFILGSTLTPRIVDHVRDRRRSSPAVY